MSPPVDVAGGSQFCCGRTAEVMVTQRQETTHTNDGHFCIASPRGITMLEINANDLRLFMRLAGRSLVSRDAGELFNPEWYIARRSFVEIEEEDTSG